jgi:hypothetical protein
MSSDDRDALRARIRALLTRTPERGCTEEEALAAASKAMELMRQHGLTEQTVFIDRAVVDLGARKPPQLTPLWAAVAYACRCTAFFRRSHTGVAIVYLGRHPWPEVASWLHAVVAGATKRAVREFTASADFKRRRVSSTRTKAKRAFTLGFVAGLVQNIRRLAAEAGDDHRRDLEQAKAALAAEGPMRSERAAKAATGGAAFADALHSGFRRGRDTSVNLGVRGDRQLALTGPGAGK